MSTVHTQRGLWCIANQKMYFVETGRAPCRKEKTQGKMQIARTMIDFQLSVSHRLLIFAGGTRHAASLRYIHKGFAVYCQPKNVFRRDGACPVSGATGTSKNHHQQNNVAKIDVFAALKVPNIV